VIVTDLLLTVTLFVFEGLPPLEAVMVKVVVPAGVLLNVVIVSVFVSVGLVLLKATSPFVPPAEKTLVAPGGNPVTDKVAAPPPDPVDPTITVYVMLELVP
jgi:hypothetical protein